MTRFHISRLTLFKAGLLFAVWSAYGLLCTWEVHYWHSFTSMPKSWLWCLRDQMTYAYLWCLATPAALWSARRFRLEGPGWPGNLLAHLGLLLILLPAIGLTRDLILGSEDSPFGHFAWGKFLRSMELTFDTGALVYVGVVGVEHAFVYYRRYQKGLIRSGQLQTQLVQAQLQALKMQLHPHFLFNTLNSITALVHEDPDMAELTITRLSELLRLFLANSTIHEVPLAEELRILDLYLEIERARFEDRLTVHYDVPDALHDAMVPNLVLQPLVENSIRHGIGRRSEPGWIAISAERCVDTLVLRVVDNGAGLSVSERPGSHQGMGLGITRGRLESLYGLQQSLVVRNLPAGGVEARITMPFRGKRYHPEAGPMQNFKVLIVDDERLSRRRVRRLLSVEPDCEIVGECANGTAAVTALGTSQPDIVFLDVQMPEMDGFEVARAIGNSKPLVIFTSAWDEYALRAFEVQAFDYLLKPFDGKRFRESLQRARIRVRCDRSGQPDRVAIPSSERPAAVRPSPDRIAVRNNGRVVFVKLSDIDWIEAADNYACLHCGRETHILRETMNELEARLDPAQFIRVHRSSIVNLDRVRELQPWFRGDYRVVLRDGTQLTLTKNHREKLESRLLLGV